MSALLRAMETSRRPTAADRPLPRVYANEVAMGINAAHAHAAAPAPMQSRRRGMVDAPSQWSNSGSPPGSTAAAPMPAHDRRWQQPAAAAVDVRGGADGRRRGGESLPPAATAYGGGDAYYGPSQGGGGGAWPTGPLAPQSTQRRTNDYTRTPRRDFPPASSASRRY